MPEAIWRPAAPRIAASSIRLVLSDLRTMLPVVSVDDCSTPWRLVATDGPNSYEIMALEALPVRGRDFLPNHDQMVLPMPGHRIIALR